MATRLLSEKVGVPLTLPIISDLGNYTPTGANQWTTNALYEARQYRIGPILRVQGTIFGTSTPSGGDTANCKIYLPTGLAIDFTALKSTGTNSGCVGYATGATSGGNHQGEVRIVSPATSNQVNVWLINPAAGSAANSTAPLATSNIAAANYHVAFWFEVPIVGWQATTPVNGGFSAGGLTPVSVVATGTSVANTLENVTLPGASINRTLPAIPTVGSAPITIIISDAGRTASDTQFIRVIPASGEEIDGLGIDEELDLNFPGAHVTFSAASGDTNWSIQTQATATLPPATETVAGFVTTEAQNFSGQKTFVNSAVFGQGPSSAITLVNNGYITSNTLDAADNRSLTIAGGGGGTAWTQNRSAGIVLQGNEVAGAEGEAVYYAGNSGGTFGRHRFVASGVDVGIISRTGQWVLTQDVPGAYKLIVNNQSGTGNGLSTYVNNSSSSYFSLLTMGAGGTIFGARADGFLQAPMLPSATGTALVRNANGYIYLDSSSLRYKKNIEDIDVGLDLIEKLRPVKYEMRIDDDKQIGFIAEEVELLDKRLVSYSMKDSQNPEEGYQVESVQYSKIVALLTKAIQQQQKQIEGLLERIKSLEGGA